MSSQDTATIADQLKGVRILLVGPSLAIMGGQSVQLDLLHKNLRSESVHIDALPINPIPWGPLRYLRAIRYLRTAVVSAFYVFSLLWRVWKYDILHVFSASYFSFIIAPTPAIVIGKLFGKKVILNYRSGEAEDHLNRWGRSIFWIIRLVDRIVVPSQYLVDVFAKFGFEADYIYNISDGSAFHFRERTECKTIIIPRNLEPLYDIETAIKAFAKLQTEFSELKLIVVGSGSDEQRLRRLVADENISGVEFTGRVERAQIPQLFEDADIFLNTSVIDNMPVAIIEAFYCGLPVVTTNAGGIPYMVEDGVNGLVVPMRDPDAVASALRRVITDSGLRRRIVAGGLEASKRFSWSAVRRQWAGLYAGIASHNA